MYCDYPSVSEESRLQHLAPLDRAKLAVTPEMAGEKAGVSAPDEVKLSSILSRPVYRFRSGRRIAVVYADSGEVFRGFQESQAREVAAAWVHLLTSDAKLETRQVSENDQWTVQQHYQAYRPLWKFAWPTGEAAYVSDVTGEVVQYTTRGSRLGSYFGAIPHWIYITRLRREAAAWSQLVIWLSGAGTVATLLGLTAGFWMYSPSKRYCFRSSPSHIPYSGQMRWHMILGLTFGLVTFTWILSGMFSMDPIPLPANPIEAKVRQGLGGGKWNGKDFENWLPSEVLLTPLNGLQPRALELTYFAGDPVYIAMASPTDTAIISIKHGVQTTLDAERVKSVVSRAASPYQIVDSHVVNRYEAYYVDRENRRRLPVLCVRLNDPQHSMLYIDLHDGRVALSYSRMERWGRWLYQGLHDFDIPWLYRHRPLWDMAVIVCLAGGTWLSITSIIIAWRRLQSFLL